MLRFSKNREGPKDPCLSLDTCLGHIQTRPYVDRPLCKDASLQQEEWNLARQSQLRLTSRAAASLSRRHRPSARQHVRAAIVCGAIVDMLLAAGSSGETPPTFEAAARPPPQACRAPKGCPRPYPFHYCRIARARAARRNSRKQCASDRLRGDASAVSRGCRVATRCKRKMVEVRKSRDCPRKSRGFQMRHARRKSRK